jgi:hypothetical protein
MSEDLAWNAKRGGRNAIGVKGFGSSLHRRMLLIFPDKEAILEGEELQGSGIIQSRHWTWLLYDGTNTDRQYPDVTVIVAPQWRPVSEVRTTVIRDEPAGRTHRRIR